MAKKKLTPKEIEALALEYSCGLFLISDSPFKEYKKLKRAKKNGKGEYDAIDVAHVWNALESGQSVNTLIEVINFTQKKYLNFLKEAGK